MKYKTQQMLGNWNKKPWIPASIIEEERVLHRGRKKSWYFRLMILHQICPFLTNLKDWLFIIVEFGTESHGIIGMCLHGRWEPGPRSYIRLCWNSVRAQSEGQRNHVFLETQTSLRWSTIHLQLFQFSVHCVRCFGTSTKPTVDWEMALADYHHAVLK